MPFDSSQYVTSGTFWFTLSLLNAGLAQSKKRSGLNWWLISLIAGPIATLLLVVWPPGDATAEPVRWELTYRQLAWILAAVVLVILGVLLVMRLTTSP